MGIFRFLRVGKFTSLENWCIAYIDVNPFRLRKVSEELQEAGIEVKTFEDGIYVKNEQYQEAMSFIQN